MLKYLYKKIKIKAPGGAWACTRDLGLKCTAC